MADSFFIMSSSLSTSHTVICFV